jgi:MFS transporter, DHA1 family, multidrug resistance protein
MQSSRPSEFIALIAFLTALMAMSIDSMLPAIGQMAEQLGATHANDRQLIILGFFVGNLLGIPVLGPMSDAIGRKPTIFGSLVIYVAGAIICMVSQSFWVLIAGRIIQGIGAGGPRIVSMAMVRDGSKGAEMARIMSFVMSVFMLVPIVAPSLGQLALNIASWRWIFGGLVIAAIIGGLWLWLRQEETLAPEHRQPFSMSALIESTVEVFQNRVCLGYTLAIGFVFGIFTAYLGVCQQIFADQYQQGDKFALWFGGFAVFIALSMIANGKLVRRIGMRQLSQKAMWAYIAVWATILVICLFTKGQPPLMALAALFMVWFFSAGFTFGNFNAMAMEPMGHIAGLAAAVSGTISQLMAIVLGGITGRFYDGTLTPLALAFTLFACLSLACVEWAERGRVPAEKSVLDPA